MIMTSAILKGWVAWREWGRLAGMTTMSPVLARRVLPSTTMRAAPSRIQTMASKGAEWVLRPWPLSKAKRVTVPAFLETTVRLTTAWGATSTSLAMGMALE